MEEGTNEVGGGGVRQLTGSRACLGRWTYEWVRARQHVSYECVAWVPCVPALRSARISGVVWGGMTADENAENTDTHTQPQLRPLPNSWEYTHTGPSSGPLTWLTRSDATWHALMHPCFHTSCSLPILPTCIIERTNTGMPAQKLCHRWAAQQLFSCNKAVFVWKKMTRVSWGESGLPQHSRPCRDTQWGYIHTHTWQLRIILLLKKNCFTEH